MAVTVSIKDEAKTLLQFLELNLAGKDLYLAMAKGVSVTFQEHFRALANTNRNPFGVSGRFWERMRGGVFFRATASDGFVAIPREAFARRYGATIRPHGTNQKTGKPLIWLTIANTVEAYRQRAGLFGEDLKFAYALNPDTGAMQAALVRKTPKASYDLFRELPRRVRAQHQTPAAGDVVYWLIKQAVLQPDESIFPTEDEIEEEMSKVIRLFLAAKARK